MADDSRSLEEIRRDTERAREGLTETVGQLRTTVAETASDLRERISPQKLRADVADYVKSRGEQLVDSVNDTIRHNPVQAVAVGATLAYPLFKLIRAIPTPVLMIGAGIYLAGSKSGQQLTQRASDAAMDAAEEMQRRARQYGADAADAAQAAREYGTAALQAAGDEVSSRADQFRRAAAESAAELRQRGDELGRNVASGADDLRRRANAAGEALATRTDELADRGAGLADSVSEAIRGTAASVVDAAASMRDGAADAAGRLRERVSDTADASLEAAARMRDRAMEASARAQKNFTDTVSAHPLLVAGAGLVIGGLIASAIPRLRLEKDTMGQAARKVRDTVGGAVAQGVDVARDRAKSVYEGATRAAEDEGLTPDGLADGVRDLGERARKVAEAAASSFDAPSQNKH